MVKKENLAKFLKLSTDRIYSGLDSNKWEGDEREAAIVVLKNRSKDVSKYLEKTPALMPASEEKITELSTLINSALEKEDNALIEKISSIIGEVQDIKELPSETVQFAIDSIKGWKKQEKVEKKIRENRTARVTARIKKIEGVVLTEERQKIVEKILADKELTKKQKVLKMWEEGLTRTETLSLHFMDPTYIYDLYREWSNA